MQQTLQRHVDEIGISQIRGPVPIRPTHRLHEQMHTGHGVDLLEVVTGDDVQHVDQRDATR